jgi:hypothetical protein
MEDFSEAVASASTPRPTAALPALGHQRDSLFESHWLPVMVAAARLSQLEERVHDLSSLA